MTTAMMGVVRPEVPFACPGNPSYPWLAIDIETTNARPEAAESWMRRMWSPDKRWKPQTIGDRYLEMLEKKVAKLGISDEAPITVVAVAFPDAAGKLTRCAYTIGQSITGPIADCQVAAYGSQADMLKGLREGLEACCTPETVLAGHNIKHFDLAMLRGACIRAGVRIPGPIANRDQPVYDTMREASRFSLDEKLFIGLDDLCEMFGLPGKPAGHDGAWACEAWARGEHAAVVEYCLGDVALEADLFLRMTGQEGA